VVLDLEALALQQIERLEAIRADVLGHNHAMKDGDGTV